MPAGAGPRPPAVSAALRMRLVLSRCRSLPPAPLPGGAAPRGLREKLPPPLFFFWPVPKLLGEGPVSAV